MQRLVVQAWNMIEYKALYMEDKGHSLQGSKHHPNVEVRRREHHGLNLFSFLSTWTVLYLQENKLPSQVYPKILQAVAAGHQRALGRRPH